MNASVPPDIQQAIDSHMATGKYATPEDVLRDAFRALQHEDEEVAAIQEAIDEWRQGVADGTVTETFACGTAAVITPVGEGKARTGDFTVGDGTPGPLTMGLREALLDIQHGRVADSHGWLHRVG